jgi:hypothetical protein
MAKSFFNKRFMAEMLLPFYPRFPQEDVLLANGRTVKLPIHAPESTGAGFVVYGPQELVASFLPPHLRPSSLFAQKHYKKYGQRIGVIHLEIAVITESNIGPFNQVFCGIPCKSKVELPIGAEDTWGNYYLWGAWDKDMDKVGLAEHYGIAPYVFELESDWGKEEHSHKITIDGKMVCEFGSKVPRITIPFPHHFNCYVGTDESPSILWSWRANGNVVSSPDPTWLTLGDSILADWFRDCLDAGGGLLNVQWTKNMKSAVGLMPK